MMPSQKVICILGPGRSGTSLVARLLSLVGLELGSSSALSMPRSHNVLGTWEHPGFSEINEDVLRALGCNVNVPPEIDSPVDWANDPKLAYLKDKAATLIARDYACSRIWGWKDPKTALTLPFWQSILPNMHYVICLRNPIDMATSFREMSGYSMRRCFSVCFSYTAHTLKYTEGTSRYLLFYEHLLSDPVRETQRLHKFLGEGFLNYPAKDDAAAHNLIREDLQHHSTSMVSMLRDPSVPLPLKILYMGLHTEVERLRMAFVSNSAISNSSATTCSIDTFLRLACSEYDNTRPAFLKLWRKAFNAIPLGYKHKWPLSQFNRTLQVLGQAGWSEVFRAFRRQIPFALD